MRKTADRLSGPAETMRAVDLPHQSLLDILDLGGHYVQLVLQHVVALAIKMGHHDVPLLVLIVLPPVPL